MEKEMKYSFMTFSTPEMEFNAVADTARKFGYSGVEIRVDAGHAHGIERDSDTSLREEARSAAADAGIEICCIATSCRFADPETETETHIQAREALELARDVGASCIRVFGGPVPESTDREESISYMSGSLLKAADFAREQNVAICLETHDDWCDPAHVARVMETCSHPFVRVNWDIMHPVRTGKAAMGEAFDILKPWIRHVHFHDGTWDNGIEMVPVGQGGIDHRRALKCLAAADYQGFLSGEWINWEPWEHHLPRELAAMKAYEQELSSSS